MVKPDSRSSLTSPLFRTAAKGCCPPAPTLAQAASLFCVEKTTSGQPLPARSSRLIFVLKESEPLAEPS